MAEQEIAHNNGATKGETRLRQATLARWNSIMVGIIRSRLPLRAKTVAFNLLRGRC